MEYLLDSNTVSDFYNRQSEDHPQIYEKISALSETDNLYISVLTVYELEYGYANAPDLKREAVRQKIEEAKQLFGILSVPAEGAHLFGQLKKQVKDARRLSKENIKKFNVDIMLATTAIIQGCVLVSADTLYNELRQFCPELKVENWLI
jgi:predicted nucleic acid-binding protein